MTTAWASRIERCRFAKAKAADLRDPYALANLGRMYWLGRGGLAVDREEAVKLYRFSAYFENPWGRFFLAEALEQGEGTTRSAEEALKLYRAVAAQDQAPDAKRLAQAVPTRLGVAVTAPAPTAEPTTLKQLPSPRRR